MSVQALVILLLCHFCFIFVYTKIYNILLVLGRVVDLQEMNICLYYLLNLYIFVVMQIRNKTRVVGLHDKGLIAYKFQYTENLDCNTLFKNWRQQKIYTKKFKKCSIVFVTSCSVTIFLLPAVHQSIIHLYYASSLVLKLIRFCSHCSMPFNF